MAAASVGPVVDTIVFGGDLGKRRESKKHEDHEERQPLPHGKKWHALLFILRLFLGAFIQCSLAFRVHEAVAVGDDHGDEQKQGNAEDERPNPDGQAEQSYVVEEFTDDDDHAHHQDAAKHQQRANGAPHGACFGGVVRLVHR